MREHRVLRAVYAMIAFVIRAVQLAWPEDDSQVFRLVRAWSISGALSASYRKSASVFVHKKVKSAGYPKQERGESCAGKTLRISIKFSWNTEWKKIADLCEMHKK